MRVYVEDMEINEMDMQDIKKKMKGSNIDIKEVLSKKIYSEDGIIEIDISGRLWLLEIIDDMLSPSTIILDKVLKMYVDKSTIKRKEQVYQIQPNHKYIVNNKYICKISSKSMIQLVIESNDEKIVDLYFETDIDIQQKYIKDDIVTFLSILNFIDYI